MKEHAPMVGGWVDTTRRVNEQLGRKMTAAEYKVAMEHYIHKATVEEIVKLFKD